MKKFLLVLVAALALSFAVPQSVDAKVHRLAFATDEDEICQIVYNDETGDFYMAFVNLRTMEVEYVYQ